MKIESVDDALAMFDTLRTYLTLAAGAAHTNGKEVIRLTAELAAEKERCGHLERRLIDHQEVCAQRDQLERELNKYDPGRKRTQLEEERRRLTAIEEAARIKQALIDKLEKEIKNL